MANRFDLTLRVGGEGGEGVMSSGELTSLGFARLGMHVYTFRTNPPEIKGGPAMFQVRISDAPVRSQGDLADMLLCFNQEAWDLHSESLRPGGTLMFDPAECSPPERTQAGRVLELPLTRIAREEVGSARSKNVVAVGVMAAFAGMPMENMADLVRQKWGRKKEEILQANLKALELGYRYTHEHVSEAEELRLPAVKRAGETIMMSGNEALSFGAIAGGLRTFFGYPITPASDIMEWLAKNLPAFGGVVVQTEDEIAAITACVGAGFAGAKVATSSSGPGVSLMVEGLGLATMQEIPLVVFDAMRSGPSTGMPTKTEQGDLNLAVLGAHGDAPRIVVAPKDVESCFHTSVDALNLAEKYQTPVVYLTDQTLAHRTETFPAPDIAAIRTVDRIRPPARPVPPPPDEPAQEHDRSHGYRRYELTPSHVSPMALPGLDDYPYVGTGLEHNEHAHIDQTPAGHTVMSDKRARKIASAADEPGWTEEYGDPTARVGVICWGSTAGPALEACEILAERGVPVKVLWTRMVWPLRLREFLAFIRGCREVLVPELNHSGQYADLLKSALYGRSSVPIVKVNKVTGLPFGAHELAEIFERHAGHRPEGREARSAGTSRRAVEGGVMTMDTLQIQRTVKDYRSEVKPTWCPGCGDFAVLNALYKAFATLNLNPKDVVVVSGIGCSGRLPEFVSTYGLHVVHGRALPTAMGVKLANPDLTVIAVGGDGDGFAIGGGHVPMVRRNVDITYIVMDNEVYGLTKGQPSPTTPAGMAAVQNSSSMPKMAPWGVVEAPLNMMGLVLTYGASFAARGFSGKPNDLSELYVKALNHKGFSFIQALSPCVTFYDTYGAWKELVAPLPEGYDPSDRMEAIRTALTENVFHTGVFYEDDRATLHDLQAAIQERTRATSYDEGMQAILARYA